MNKYFALLLTFMLILTGCNHSEDEKSQDAPKKETVKKDTKKEEKDKKDKSDAAKKKIAENQKKKEQATIESTTEAPTSEAMTQEIATTEAPSTEAPATAEVLSQDVYQQPQVPQTAQQAQPSQQEIIDFCKNVRGEIPEVCRTPVIVDAGNQKGALEQQAAQELEAGLITQEQYYQKLQEATGIMDRAWEQEFGVNPNQQ
ncbi:hypothetical protein [Macrococcoides caseolyticum]|uniref:hypothetical protein n=1 Tax=Macrococcoides caseolyticum TaxID=69966 RepID=UPI001F295EB0|nr:hypothetical protein [Macrococcus caseolyticus]MCE4955997.1 hypothetical protein [Macrococcus caseolyticus]